MYNVESDFVYKGYRCIGTFGDMGHRCGYVGLPKGHPLYGKHYDDKLNVTYNDIAYSSIGKKSPIQMLSLVGSELEDKVSFSFYFDVHGGITYEDGGQNSKYPIESDLWWLGFDCGHAGDGKDLDLVEQLWGNDEHIKLRLKSEREFQLHFPDDVIRTKEYVVEECKNLVDQIIDYCERYEKMIKEMIIREYEFEKNCPWNCQENFIKIVNYDNPWQVYKDKFFSNNYDMTHFMIKDTMREDYNALSFEYEINDNRYIHVAQDWTKQYNTKPYIQEGTND